LHIVFSLSFFFLLSQKKEIRMSVSRVSSVSERTTRMQALARWCDSSIPHRIDNQPDRVANSVGRIEAHHEPFYDWRLWLDDSLGSSAATAACSAFRRR
jgi:hypothetical protein